MKNTLWITLVALLSLNFACTQAAYESASGGNYQTQADKSLYEEGEFEQAERKIIYNGSMSIKVKDLEDQTNQVIEKAKAQGGYMVSSDIDRVTVRIPAEKLNSFMDEMATFGTVESRNVYSQDITDQYADMSMRVENAEKARKRYLELLEQATEVSDILAIEKELERLNGEIERLQGQINSYDKQVQYSSVSIYFIEKVKPGPVGYIFLGLYKAVKFLFVRG
jgi:polyhydroxyalkanoate synthesis regulator phasin